MPVQIEVKMPRDSVLAIIKSFPYMIMIARTRAAILLNLALTVLFITTVFVWHSTVKSNQNFQFKIFESIVRYLDFDIIVGWVIADLTSRLQVLAVVLQSQLPTHWVYPAVISLIRLIS